MATMTKLATMTWPSNEAQNLPAITEARVPYIETQISIGHTDGVADNLSPTVTTRKWSDQTAAENWANFITTTATNAGTSVNVVITDLV
jgi:hypothetical protein